MRWSRDELLLALHLYERIPFGQQHAKNPEVCALAERIGRTPASVAMKLCNFTSLDPEELARGVRGLSGASQLDQETWAEFQSNPDIVENAEALWLGEQVEIWEGATERTATRKIRLAQGYFRRVVLSNFEVRCAITGIAEPALLVASHIVPWSEDPRLRVNPANGICLNRLHDSAFDRRLVTFDEDGRLVIGRRLRRDLGEDALSKAFLDTEGVQLRVPIRRALDPALIARHREQFICINRQ